MSNALNSTVDIPPYSVGRGQPLLIIAGPCVIEDGKHTLKLAGEILEICRRHGLPLLFKASFDKANRSSVDSFRGPGLDEGLAILREVRSTHSVPVISDVHEPAQAEEAAQSLDAIQIPAFLCRQTDLLLAAGRSGKPIQLKKGQFVSPHEMMNAVEKIRSTGNQSVILCERGTFFGYNRLVNDMTSLAVMRESAPVVFDVTHSTQEPGGAGHQSGGRREVGPLLARAACGAGVNGLFLEVHDRPEEAKSDSAVVMPLDWLDDLLDDCRRIHEIVSARHD